MTDTTAFLTLPVAWQFLSQRLDEAELDGFIAAHFLNRYESEVHTERLAEKVKSLQENFEFSRNNLASLGIMLERGWISASPAVLSQFTAGFEKLERQQSGTAVTLHNSLKLLYGVSLGFTVATVKEEHAHLLERMTRLIEEFQRGLHNKVRDYILASVLLSQLQPTRQNQIVRDLSYFILRLTIAELVDRDVLAILWLLRRDYFVLGARLSQEHELEVLYKTLMPRLLRITQVYDVFDACLMHAVQAELLRDISSGQRLSQDTLSIVLRTIDGFPEISRKLRARRKGKAPFTIEDEYDVQDLLYVTLKPHIPDLSDEEWTAKEGAGSKRIDFVTVAGKLVIEAKKTRRPEHAKGIPDELKIDIESYYIHPACDTLVCFIYDPDMYMVDAEQQELQLSGTRSIKGRTINVIVRIRPR